MNERTRGPNWLLIAAAAALVAVMALFAVWSLRPGPAPTVAEQAAAIAAELRCPDCQGLSAADSPTAAAAEIRREIRAQLEAGATADEIRATFVARYGEWILLRPTGWLPWLIPLAAILGGVALWLAWLRPRGAPVEEVASDEAPTGRPTVARVGPDARARRLAGGAVVVVAVGLAVGSFVSAPWGLANPTVVNQALADAQAQEAARQERLTELLTAAGADPTNPDILSDLADAYLAGSSTDDLQRAALTLLAVIQLDPKRTDAYTRLITAYIRAADWDNAQQATDALAELTPGAADVAFFNGLIAWRGHADADAAIAAFDEFLAAAPGDPRATMIRALRAEATAR